MKLIKRGKRELIYSHDNVTAGRLNNLRKVRT